MKKFVTISMLLLLIYNMGGFYVAFISIQQHLKEVMMEYIESGAAKNHTEVLVFDYADGKITDKNFEWTSDENEFTYNNCRYDIVKKEVKGKSIEIYCINDKEESFVLSLLGEQENTSFGENNLTHKNTLSLLKIFQYDYTLISRITLNQQPAFSQNKYCESRSHHNQKIFLNIFSPPPEV